MMVKRCVPVLSRNNTVSIAWPRNKPTSPIASTSIPMPRMTYRRTSHYAKRSGAQMSIVGCHRQEMGLLRWRPPFSAGHLA